MTPYYSDDSLVVYQGDCREVMAGMEPESVHCVVTSPPYWGLRDYGVDGQIGLEDSVDEFVEAMVGVFREVRRVLRPDGTVWLNLGDTYAGGGRGGSPEDSSFRKQATNRGSLVAPSPVPAGLKPKDRIMVPARVALALQADGWWLRDEIVWAKPNPMPSSVLDRTTPAHEMVYLLTKSARYYYDTDAIREPLAESSVGRLAAALKNHEEYDPTRHKHDARSSAPMDVMVRLAKRAGIETPTGHVRGQGVVWEGSVDELAPDMDAGDVAGAPRDPREGEGFAVGKVGPNLIGKTDVHGPVAQRTSSGWNVNHDRPDTVGRYAQRSKTAVSPNPRTRQAPEPGEPNAFHPGGRNKRSVWTIPTKAYPDAHFATFPEDLIKPMILAGCPEGGTVLDPFAGSGTTGMVAQSLSRRAVLIDLNGEYLTQVLRRNRQPSLGLAG